MTPEALDPVIHAPTRLRIVVTLATLADGDALAFTRLKDLIKLTPGNLTTHLRKLEDARYITITKTGNGPASRTRVSLTATGRDALTHYRQALRELLETPTLHS